MDKSDNENLINMQSNTQFEDESNPPLILPSNKIDAHEDFSFKIDQNSSVKACINVNSNGIPSPSSLDSQVIITDLKNKIIGEQNNVEDVKTKVDNGELKETVSVLEIDPVEKSDSAVLRKLLRGPRYFDPPDNNWGHCSNCGEAGHTVAKCSAAKRKKPCFVCGSLEHNAKRCKQGRVCFNCKQGGHRAINCPGNSVEEFQKTKLCLKCGDSGHEMFTCRTVYSPDDLKEIQCYMCKCFGHLCCVDYGTDLSVVSCYKCGQLGHTGLECTCSSAYQNEETTNTALPSSCKKCGKEGHKTRNCKIFPKKRVKRRDRKANKDSRKRIKTENGSSNSSQPKRRGGWINEDHGGYHNGTQWGSPSTPVTYIPQPSSHVFMPSPQVYTTAPSAAFSPLYTMSSNASPQSFPSTYQNPSFFSPAPLLAAPIRPQNSFHEYHYPSGLQYEASGSNGHHQHRFSASRFGNSSNHSPSTPVTYRPMNSFHEYHYPSGLQYEASGSNGHHQHRFSASRFGNSSNHERREYRY